MRKSMTKLQWAGVWVGVLLLVAACPQPDLHDQAAKPVEIRRMDPIWDFYTGVLLEIKGPGDNVFWLWPEEYWSWIEEDGNARGGFVRSDFIEDFHQDEGGAIHYRLTMAPRDCTIQVRITPSQDSLLIEHEIVNQGGGTVLGGSPCLQIGRAKDFQSWTFEQAKRTFLWTRQDGFTWLSDTRRSGRDVHISNKPFAQNYHFEDPEKMHKAFGRSPDFAASGLIGAVSADERWLVACVSENADGVAHGLMNCLHSSHSCRTGPGEKKTFQYRVYFLPHDMDALVARASRDFPKLRFPQPDPKRIILGRATPPIESFEDRKSYGRIEVVEATVESTLVRRLTREGGAAPTYGATHGYGAALCDFADGGRVRIPSLFIPTPGNRFFSVDLTVPEDRDLRMIIHLLQGDISESGVFELSPGTARRCVVPMGRLRPNEAVDFVLVPADGQACLVQMDSLALY
jgi:hypothetical protein